MELGIFQFTESSLDEERNISMNHQKSSCILFNLGAKTVHQGGGSSSGSSCSWSLEAVLTGCQCQCFYYGEVTECKSLAQRFGFLLLTLLHSCKWTQRCWQTEAHQSSNMAAVSSIYPPNQSSPQEFCFCSEESKRSVNLCISSQDFLFHNGIEGLSCVDNCCCSHSVIQIRANQFFFLKKGDKD